MDDAALVRKITRQLLSQYGLSSTDEAVHGADAVAKVKMAMDAGRSYDAILMDSSMKIMCGPEAAEAIRKLGYKGKIFGVTGHSDEASINEFLRKGADRVIVKPMTQGALSQILDGN